MRRVLSFFKTVLLGVSTFMLAGVVPKSGRKLVKAASQGLTENQRENVTLYGGVAVLLSVAYGVVIGHRHKSVKA